VGPAESVVELVDLEPLNGCPVTLTSTSGKVAHPLVDTKVQRAAVPCATRPRPFTPSDLLVEKLISPTVDPPSVTFQSAGGPGVEVGATLSSAPAAGILPSGP
jgi:hypothetical protein